MFRINHRVDVYFHEDENGGQQQALAQILDKLNLVLQNQKQMGQELVKLTQEVTETKTVMASAKALIDGFKARLDEAIGDKAKLVELSNELDTSSNELAAAVAANTVAEEETPETPQS
jgi:hypothetical protein